MIKGKENKKKTNKKTTPKIKKKKKKKLIYLQGTSKTRSTNPEINNIFS